MLKTGGRLSMFEPINRFTDTSQAILFWGFDVKPVQELAQKVHEVYTRLQPRDSDPMFNFDERDLIALVEQAGFAEVHLDLHVNIQPVPPLEWNAFAKIAANPLVPTLEEAITQALTALEAERFINHLRPLVEQGQGVVRSAVAYLWAKK